MKDGKHIDADGTQRWYQNRKLHREDGPAIIWANGTEVWYQNGKCHREDGPALVYPSEAEFWYHHGVPLSEDEIQQRKRELEADSWIREMLTS